METTQHDMDKYAKKGVANTALGLSIGALAWNFLNGNGLPILGGSSNNSANSPTAYDVLLKQCAQGNELTNAIWQTRVTDLQEKFDIYTRLTDRIVNLEKSEAATAVALPLMYQLSKCESERYSDNQLNHAVNHQKDVNCALQSEILMRPKGDVRLSMSSLYTGVPQLPPLSYCVGGCNCGGDSKK